MKSKYRSSIYTIGIALLLLAIADIAYWCYITSQYIAFADCKAAYLAGFPAPLQNATVITAICVFLLGSSAFIFVQAAKANYYKRLSIILAGLSGLLCSWQIFSMM